MINPKIDLVKAVPGVVAVKKKKKVLTTRIQELSQKWNQLKLPKAVAVRGKYFAERASICDRHLWCALGQNS